jgi:hypothetical protein
MSDPIVRSVRGRFENPSLKPVRTIKGERKK